MTREGTHRRDYRTGPENRWAQKKAYHLMQYGRPGFVGLRMRAAMRIISPGVYAIPSWIVSEWQESLRRFEPYAHDTEGTVWE